MNELRKCPFCGSEGEVYNANCRTPDADGTKQVNWIVDCSSCNFSNAYEHSREESIEAWNTRASDKHYDLLLDAVEGVNTFEDVSNMHRETQRRIKVALKHREGD